MLPSSITALHPPYFLARGNRRQRRALAVLQRLDIFRRLAPFDVRLAGTVPIAVDIPGSDLDILCKADAYPPLLEILRKQYGAYPGFSVDRHPDRLLVRFKCEGVPVEIYAASTSTEKQRAWVHMIAEWHLLQQADRGAIQAIRHLKTKGMKTEPAFAHYFGLAGDPYETLYRMGQAIIEKFK